MHKLRDLLIRQIDAKKQPTLYFAEADLDLDARPLAAVWGLKDIAKVVLVGKEDKIRKNALNSSPYAEFATKEGFEIDNLIQKTLEAACVIDPESDAQKEKRKQYAEAALKKVGEKWKKTEKNFLELAKDPIFFALMATAEIEDYPRHGHAVLGGLHSTSANFFAPGLRLHPRTGTVFEAAVFAFKDDNCPVGVYPGNIVIFGDVAVITEMSGERLADIAIGTSKIARDLLPEDEFPEIYASMVCYSTSGSGSGQVIDIVREAHTLIESKLANLRNNDSLFKQISITPEVQFSVAVDKNSAEKKLDIHDPKHSSAGRSNVIILPSLAVGNIMYHLHASYYQDAEKSLVVGGFKNNSVLDFSRTSEIEDVILGGTSLVLRQQYLKDFNPDISC